MSGLVITKDEVDAPSGMELLHAGHPFPDVRSVLATQRAIELCRAVSASDELLVLLSGGTSALLGGPLAGESLDELRALTDQLLRSGATIDQVNAVRRRHGAALGGRLLRATHASIRALVVSDVLSGDLRTIGSGPLHPDDPTEQERAQLDVEIIASPELLLDEAAAQLRHFTCTTSLHGGTMESLIAELAAALARLGPGEASIVVGEPTIEVTGGGRGGRCQHAALALLSCLPPDCAALALASDGSDGPTMAAGGLVHAEMRHDVRAALANHDSGPALESLGGLVVTGPTGTNLTDLYIVARAPD